MTRPAELHLLGVSFRTAPVAVRKALHFDREQALGFVRELEGIVAEEVERFARWVGGAPTEDLIRSLFGDAALASREAAGLVAGAEHVGPADVERVFLRSFKRLLHGHVRRLRAASPSEAPAFDAAAPGF